MVQLLLQLELFYNISEKNHAFQTGVVFSSLGTTTVSVPGVNFRFRVSVLRICKKKLIQADYALQNIGYELPDRPFHSERVSKSADKPF